MTWKDYLKFFRAIQRKRICINFRNTVGRIVILWIFQIITISFSRKTETKRSIVLCWIVSRLKLVMDFGVLVDSRLIFDQHIRDKMKRALRVLQFSFNCAGDFGCPEWFIHSYCFTNRSIFKYSSVIRYCVT